jgi:hypothetical protein
MAEALRRDGYAIAGPRLGPEALGELATLYREATDEAGRDESGEFLPSMMIPHPGVRARIWDGIGRIAGPPVEALFGPGTMEVSGGLFVSKPASPNSHRQPHQDATGFDESRYVVISVWIPLTDSTVGNGTICILPGSHRMDNFVRPRDVESFDDDVRDIALAEAVPIELEAGQMLVVDAAVVHHSPANESGEERVAVICSMRHAGAQIEFVQSEDGAPTGTASRYRADEQLFRTGDVTRAVLDEASLITRTPYRPATVADLAASRARA